ncbi:MAG: PAS domain-containing protein, partial [Chloroflexi bacterium]|nr:PAS domain-containing protein [Chloroflexota bacterium]
KRLADVTPIPIYWLDKNNAALGANKQTLEAVGGKSIADFIGKTAYEYYPFEMADNIVKHCNLVMQTGKILSKEEPIRDVTTGETKYFNTFKAPLYDNNGKIIGLVGTSVNITAEKNAERLKLENEQQKAKLEEQLRFKKLVDQAAYDAQSPFAILLVLLQHCSNLTKDEVLDDPATI